MGHVITFYSYKGGVGRTMALANIATLLASWGKRVLIVDWDLEAPGVEHFFFSDEADLRHVQNKPGLIELLTELSCKSDEQAGLIPAEASVWKPFVSNVTVAKTSASFDLISAGSRGNGYFKNVRSLDVKAFYEEKSGGYVVESLRQSWKANYDFVLVDSRTGITDIGGVCTIQLPDILAIVFTATAQSLEGAVHVARKAAVERQRLPFDRPVVPILPIPSRFDTQTEHEISKQWLKRFETTLRPVYEDWLPTSVSRSEFLKLTKIPYTAYFSFGECLPVVEQGTKDPAGLGFAYETVAALIGNKLEYSDLLLTNRDECVKVARIPGTIPKMPLRTTDLNCVLYIDFGSRGLQSMLDETVNIDALQGVQSGIQELTGEERGTLIEAQAQTCVFAFAQEDQAVRCGLKIQEKLLVGNPVKMESGQLGARIAVHAAPKTERSSGHEHTRELRDVASSIVARAREGELLISKEAWERAQGRVAKTVRAVNRVGSIELNNGASIVELLSLEQITPVELTDDEQKSLFETDPESKGGGGFQALLVNLQKKVKNGRIDLTLSDRERIARYAHDYKGGGWQGRLRRIFGRSLGHDLGREQPSRMEQN